MLAMDELRPDSLIDSELVFRSSEYTFSGIALWIFKSIPEQYSRLNLKFVKVHLFLDI